MERTSDAVSQIATGFNMVQNFAKSVEYASDGSVDDESRAQLAEIAGKLGQMDSTAVDQAEGTMGGSRSVGAVNTREVVSQLSEMDMRLLQAYDMRIMGIQLRFF